MACETRSGPDQLPAGGVTERFSTSLRWPEDRLRSVRPAPEASALSVAVPVSSSEPAMRRAVPTSVTSVMGWPPVRAAREFCKRARACALEEVEGAVCWAKTGKTKSREKNAGTYVLAKRIGPPEVVHEPSEVGCAPSEQERENRCRRQDTYREDFKETIGGIPEFRRRKGTFCGERRVGRLGVRVASSERRAEGKADPSHAKVRRFGICFSFR